MGAGGFGCGQTIIGVDTRSEPVPWSGELECGVPNGLTVTVYTALGNLRQMKLKTARFKVSWTRNACPRGTIRMLGLNQTADSRASKPV